MTHQTFDVLETKIDQIIQWVGKLRKENQELKSKNQELTSIITEKEKKIQVLTEEAEQSRVVQNEIAGFQDKQQRIRTKVENLLEKLQEFEKLE
ncbi:MAG TPA: cell division protein ZapB [bacterium]|nr:cell division protein ZapB [bacterium]